MTDVSTFLSELTQIAHTIRAKLKLYSNYSFSSFKLENFKSMVTLIPTIPTTGLIYYTDNTTTSLGYRQFCSLYSNIVHVTFPACETIGKETFAACWNLGGASFPVCETIGSSAFNDCRGLKTASFDNCITINNSAFYGCSALKDINFPNCVSIGNSAFYNCIRLSATLDFPNCEYIGDYAFTNAINTNYISTSYYTSRYSINIPKCKYIGAHAFQVNQRYNISEVYASQCSYIGSGAFSNCYDSDFYRGLRSVVFSDSVHVDKEAFANSRWVDFDVRSCTYIGESAFYYCGQVLDMSRYVSPSEMYPVLELSQCTHIGAYAFSSCASTSMYELSLPVCTYIGSYAFQNVSKLQRVRLGSVFCSAGEYPFGRSDYFWQQHGTPATILVPSSLYSRYIREWTYGTDFFGSY